MDQLRLRMDVLRMLARQPASADRQHLAEREINQYLPDEVGDGKVSLERLSKAIDEEAKKGGDWTAMKEYIQWCFLRLPDAKNGRKTKPPASTRRSAFAGPSAFVASSSLYFDAVPFGVPSHRQ
jgi:hypothetical protein